MMEKLASRIARAGSTPVVLAVLFIGCGGGEPAPAVPPPAPSATPSAAPEPPPEPSASAAAAAPAPSASASASPAKPQSSGRPAVLKSDPMSITDGFGSSPGAKIEIGEGKEIATLRIQENTLGQLTSVTFKIDAKGKANGATGGKIYHLTPVLPSEGKPVTVPSNNGTPFELSLPGGGKRGVNLAIGSIETDDAGREKIKWQVIAPKRVDEGMGVAYFELPELKDAYMHITSKAPAAAVEKK